VEVTLEGERELAVYKPLRGERPLWDFPPGLFKREIAAWQLSEALGWGLVPRTIRRDGPFGEGALQRFIDLSSRGCQKGGERVSWSRHVVSALFRRRRRREAPP